MKTDYDENVLEFWKLLDKNYTVKKRNYEGLDAGYDFEKTLPANLGALF